MARREELTDEQWAIIESLIPPPRRRRDGPGRPWREICEVLNGILWILRSGARWQVLPEVFRRTRPATADSNNGCTMARSNRYSKPWPLTSKNGATSICQNALLTAKVFLSPSTRRLLARLKSDLSVKLSLKFLPMNDLSDL